MNSWLFRLPAFFSGGAELEREGRGQSIHSRADHANCNSAMIDLGGSAREEQYCVWKLRENLYLNACKYLDLELRRHVSTNVHDNVLNANSWCSIYDFQEMIMDVLKDNTLFMDDSVKTLEEKVVDESRTGRREISSQKLSQPTATIGSPKCQKTFFSWTNFSFPWPPSRNPCWIWSHLFVALHLNRS